MGLFNRKPKIVKEIHDAAWGTLVSQGINVDQLTHDVRCVEKNGNVDNVGKTVLVRVFRMSEAKKANIEVTGWETFDTHPELVLFDGYFTGWNTVHLERKRT